jgi:hypothetical protein
MFFKTQKHRSQKMAKLFAAVAVVTLMAFFAGCNKPPVPPPGNPPSPQPITQADDRAVLVGINAYPNAPLAGCINDVLDMKNFLITVQGFKPEQIVVLIDGQATRKAIMEKLVWLTRDAKAGDRRYFHFSGHGTEFAGRDLDKQPDGLNQVICPYDFNWTLDTMVMDVDFVDVFKTMPNGVLFNWASDSCHSGDLTRTINKPNVKPRQYPKIPEDVQTQIRKAKEANLKSRGFIDGVLDVGFVSGCRYNQTSADAYEGGKPCGAMTYFLLQVLKDKKDYSLNEIVGEMNTRLRENGYEQEPQAEGARARKQFLKP